MLCCGGCGVLRFGCGVAELVLAVVCWRFVQAWFLLGVKSKMYFYLYLDLFRKFPKRCAIQASARSSSRS